MTKPIFKFKVSNKNYRPTIEKVEIVRETNACVFLPSNFGGSPRRESKSSDWANYFDTFDQAKDFLISHWEKILESKRRSLESAKGTFGNVKGMKESNP